jgi:hypothetical protein
MEIPSRVSVYNQTLGVKGNAGLLVAVNETGYYEVNLEVKDRVHTVLFPIGDTVLIFNEPVPQLAPEFDIER